MRISDWSSDVCSSDLASAIAADRSTAAARVTLASRQLARERTLLNQGVSPRADYEPAEANLAVAQAQARQARAAPSPPQVSRDDRSVPLVSSISAPLQSAPATPATFHPPLPPALHVSYPHPPPIHPGLPTSHPP